MHQDQVACTETDCAHAQRIPIQYTLHHTDPVVPHIVVIVVLGLVDQLHFLQCSLVTLAEHTNFCKQGKEEVVCLPQHLSARAIGGSLVQGPLNFARKEANWQHMWLHAPFMQKVKGMETKVALLSIADEI